MQIARNVVRRRARIRERSRGAARDDREMSEPHQLARDGIGQPRREHACVGVGRVRRERQHRDDGLRRPGIAATSAAPRRRADDERGDNHGQDSGDRATARGQARLRGCNAGVARRFGAAHELGRVATLLEHDRDRVARARAAVVLVELRTQPPGLDAHDRVDPRVVALIAVEHLDPDHVLLEPLRFTGERPLDDEAQKTAQAARSRERPAREHTVERGADLVGRRLHRAILTRRAAPRRVGAETFGIHRSTGEIARVCRTAHARRG